MKLSRYLLTLAFCLAAFGAVACSDDSSSSPAADDNKKESGLQVFDTKADLPSCDKFDGVVAQVIDEKAFFACVDDSWEQVDFSAPSYEQLPKCDASMNDFCVDIVNDDKVDASYVCDEGKWVKGRRSDGGCVKGNENSSGSSSPSEENSSRVNYDEEGGPSDFD